ncbi:MAG TPA: DNA repair protein RadA [Candidatus Saccharimonadales bacterium]|nr:DNA repair protein RadA [Candidatus Saccharimonadales bacterium]
MAKIPQFVCQECGALHTKWSGRCDKCGQWNSLIENTQLSEKELTAQGRSLTTTPVNKVSTRDSLQKRIITGLKEIDTVFGGGLVPDSVTLLAGQPGIGKSTLLMQIAGECAKKQKVLYVSGEESVSQVHERASRLGVASSSNLMLASSTSADDIAHTIADGEYGVVIVDSIQTISLGSVASNAGSISQVTNCASLLTQIAKRHHSALILVGHVTKEGSIAGPKVLEHLVDVVLHLEGDVYGGFKILRAAKNRYGSTQETAILEMAEDGLRAVLNPSKALLAERQVTDGSVVLATIEGSRPLLVEVQALINRSNFGYPKRTASGFDMNRLTLLVAVLERRTSLSLSDMDIYINIVGGMRLNDPAADLAVCMAIASSARQMKLPESYVVAGEVGLSGEIRRVPFIESRCREAAKAGFKTLIGPNYGSKYTHLAPTKNLRDALNTYLKSTKKEI